METKIEAEKGHQDLFITREFDLPLDLLFKAYTEAKLIEQWMGTHVIKHESKTHGAWRFETKDPNGNIVFSSHGVIHEFIPEKRITRTFEMENADFPAQLEYLDFEKLTDSQSKLRIQIVFKSQELRDKMLKLPFAYGLNMAHNRLQELNFKA